LELFRGLAQRNKGRKTSYLDGLPPYPGRIGEPGEARLRSAEAPGHVEFTRTVGMPAAGAPFGTRLPALEFVLSKLWRDGVTARPARPG
jgi:hypothetical protein